MYAFPRVWVALVSYIHKFTRLAGHVLQCQQMLSLTDRLQLIMHARACSPQQPQQPFGKGIPSAHMRRPSL